LRTFLLHWLHFRLFLMLWFYPFVIFLWRDYWSCRIAISTHNLLGSNFRIDPLAPSNVNLWFQSWGPQSFGESKEKPYAGIRKVIITVNRIILTDSS
jgi:hypothetical protein